MRKLLLTGGTGFVGRNVKPLMDRLYQVTTCGMSSYNAICADLAKDIPSLADKYDVVLHAAGKAHVVPTSEKEIKEFFDVNYQGTVNLCSALEKAGVPNTFIFISTVAVYGLDSGMDIDEQQVLNPQTPYAISKKKAEEYLLNWCKDNHVKLCILRPSLIAGPNPPGNLGAMIKGISSGKYVRIGGGKARKSVLMVEDIARLTPLLEGKEGIFNICSDDQPMFREVDAIICKQLDKSLPVNIPMWFAKILAMFGDLLGERAPFNFVKLSKMTGSLTFSNEKAKRELDWKPLSVFDNFIIK